MSLMNSELGWKQLSSLLNYRTELDILDVCGALHPTNIILKMGIHSLGLMGLAYGSPLCLASMDLLHMSPLCSSTYRAACPLVQSAFPYQNIGHCIMVHVYGLKHQLIMWPQSNKMLHSTATISFVLGKEYGIRKKEMHAQLHWQSNS